MFDLSCVKVALVLYDITHNKTRFTILKSFGIVEILVKSASAFLDYGPLVERNFISKFGGVGLKLNVLDTKTATQQFPLNGAQADECRCPYLNMTNRGVRLRFPPADVAGYESKVG